MAIDYQTMTLEEEPTLAHYAHLENHQASESSSSLLSSEDLKAEQEVVPNLDGNWYEGGTTYRIRQLGGFISFMALSRLGAIQFQGKGDLRDGILQVNLWFTDGTWGFCSLMLMDDGKHLGGTLVNGVSGVVQSIRLERD